MAEAVQQSRVKNSIRNTLFAAIAYVVKMLLQFAVRAVFVRYFVVEYLGINGLYSNILNVLSLAELGVGNAIVYSMYKPIAENDIEKVKSLVNLYKKLYLIIGCAVTVLGLSLIPALPYIIKDAPNLEINLTFIYVLYLAQTVIGYFFAYRRSLIFAYQRNDVESKVSLISQILLAISQILIIILWKNFYAYTAAFVICSALDALGIFVLSYKLFPEIKGKAQKLEKTDTKQIAKNTGAMVFHKIGSAVVFSTDSIIISAYIGSAILGIYSNYTLVTVALGSLINVFVTAFKGSIGNLIASKSKEDVYKIFLALHMGSVWMTGFIFIGLFVCFQDFELVFTGNSDYLLAFSTVALLTVSFFLTYSKCMVGTFKECAGLFWNDRFRALFEAGINLGLDLLFVRFLGIDGVLLATIISTVTTILWIEPFVLYKHYFNKNPLKYFARYGVYLILIAVVGAAAYGICYFIPSGNIGWFILKFAVCLILPNLLFICIVWKTKEFKYLLSVAKGLFGKKNAPEPTEN